MNFSSPIRHTAASHPKLALLMVLCGVAGAASSGPLFAANSADDVPQIVVRYSPDSLATDLGAKKLYRRLVRAAEGVCPLSAGSRLAGPAVQSCRDESIARAVHQINSPRLAAVYAASAKSG